MAITAGNVTTTANTTGTLTNVLSRPAGVAGGDVLVAGLAINSTTTATTYTLPTGWTTAYLHRSSTQGQTVWLAYRVLPADISGEPTTYTFTWSTSGTNGAGLVAYRGANTTTPQDVAAAAVDDASATTHSAPSITTVTDGALWVTVVQPGSSSVNTTPPTTTPVTTERCDTAGSALELSDQVRTTAGATGTKVFTLASAKAAQVVSWGLRPAAAAGGAAANPAAVLGHL